MRRLWLLFSVLVVYPSAANALFFGEDGRQDPICFGEGAAEVARAVAKFKDFFTGVGGGCTAYLISPENHVLTAAHCVVTDDFTAMDSRIS